MFLLTLLWACGPDKTAALQDNGPTQGWKMEEGWRSACFEPGPAEGWSDKQRDDTVRAMSAQWAGQRRDGVSFDAEMSAELAQLLGDKDVAFVHQVAMDNHAKCVEVMAENATTSAWGTYLEELHAELAEEACPEPLEDTFHTLDVSTGWQGDVALCAGESVRIKASTSNLYQVDPEGPYVRVMGEGPAVEGDPCTDLDCQHGMLIARFEGESGEVLLLPVGGLMEWTAPEAGTLSVRVNDAQPEDNAYRMEEGVRDGITVEYRPL